MFDELNYFISKNSTRYLSRFNFSACELWLCTELCHILNFEIPPPTKGDWFVYNEDCKRDLSVYIGENLTHHIEVKVVYPSYSLQAKKNWYESLESKFNALDIVCKDERTTRSAWIYLVWTTQTQSRIRYGTLDLFFDNIIKDIKQIHSCDNLSLIDVLDSSIHWRGEDKRIVVKAIELNF